MLEKIGKAILVGGAISLVVAINKILHKGIETLDETNRTLAEVRNSIHGLTKESKQMIHTANQITKDVQDKADSMDPLLESVHDIGEIIHNVTNTAKNLFENAEKPALPSVPELNHKVRVNIG